MLIKHKKLQPLHCYHIFSDSRDVYLSKNCYEHYSPRMVPVTGNSGSGSWPIIPALLYWIGQASGSYYHRPTH